MFGDLILTIQKLIKQLCCIHDYKVTQQEVGRQTFLTYECKKCGYMKVKEI